MRKIVIITGMTASGKSGLAIDIARRYNGEIISVDSVQIYRGLDIGSAKEPIKIREEILHHLIDIKNFDETYNVGQFISDCQNAIEDIINRGKLPIIVGGTGLYVKALLEGYSLGGTAGNDEFREQYQLMAREQGNEAVWKVLNEQDPELAKTVHYNNIKRIIRYLEIEKFGRQECKQESILSEYDVCALGIVADRVEIYNKINQRVDIMLEEGLEQEVKGLISNGATRENQSMNSIGYKEWFDYFEGRVDKSTTIDLIKQHTRNYCKRQLTFMKTINDLRMVSLDEAKNIIKEFLDD